MEQAVSELNIAAQIEKQLEASGWKVVNNKLDLEHLSGGHAIRKVNSVEPSYSLLIDNEYVGLISSFKMLEDPSSYTFNYYFSPDKILFTNYFEPELKTREVYGFHRPDTLAKWLKSESTLRKRLKSLPPLNPYELEPAELGLRDCQEKAIKNLEESLRENKERSLIQMATGSGKTYTAINSIYRLLKYSNAKRILFLVDTKSLGIQAEHEMLNFVPPDSNLTFSQLYAVHRMKSSHVPTNAQVYICTIQRLYSILSGKTTSEEETFSESPDNCNVPSTVEYNSALPIEFFDVIFVDECHRSIYNVWQQIFDYFDAMIVGLTATPDKRTYGFFEKNVVYQYSHQDAVADGVNVDSDVYLIQTDVTKNGGKLKAYQPTQYRQRLTKNRYWLQQDQDESYSAKQLDSAIVNPSQITTIIETFKDSLSQVFPNRTHVPKTLIFAKNDSHADDIVRLVRKIFKEENDFCEKITYRANEDVIDQNGNVIEKGENPENRLARFRNSYLPRIAVTVDMIATGTDIKALESLIFMRDVKSRNYFEQMKGRGARILEHEKLKQVTPDAESDKTHFVIYDAIGATQSLVTPTQPLILKSSIPLIKLLTNLMLGAYGTQTVSSVAGRLTRLDKQIDDADRKLIERDSGGVSLAAIAQALFKAIDPDNIQQRAKQLSGGSINEQDLELAQQQLVHCAANVLNETLINTIVLIRRNKDQRIDHFTPDHVTYAGWSSQKRASVEAIRNDFQQYMADNIDNLTALQIYYQEPYRRREVTFSMVNDILSQLKKEKPYLAPQRVWDAYAELDQYQSKRPEVELQLLVSLIRRVSGMDQKLSPFSDTVRRNFQRWILSYNAGVGQKFSKEQMNWLRMIRDHIASSMHFEMEDLDRTPFDAEGSRAKMYDLFGDDMSSLIDTLNNELAA